MPCLVLLLAVVAPRIVAVALWFFTTFFNAAFAGRLWLLVVGVLLMPLTTLTYAWAFNAEGGVHSTFFLVVIVVAAIVDLGGLAGSRRARY